MTSPDKNPYTAALEAQGYTVFLAVGLQERPDGDGNIDYRVKVAANPALKFVSEDTFDTLADTIREALAKLYRIPMDDLEIQ